MRVRCGEVWCARMFGWLTVCVPRDWVLASGDKSVYCCRQGELEVAHYVLHGEHGCGVLPVLYHTFFGGATAVCFDQTEVLVACESRLGYWIPCWFYSKSKVDPLSWLRTVFGHLIDISYSSPLVTTPNARHAMNHLHRI